MLGKLLVLIVMCAFVGVTTWIAKLQIKRKMELQMGRKVDDSELTSITGWMKAHARADEVGLHVRAGEMKAYEPADEEINSAMMSKPCTACGFLNQLNGVTCFGCGRPIGS